jgi:hypothetical protein
MKKCISVLALFAIFTAGAFAMPIDMSVGGGVFGGMSWSNTSSDFPDGIDRVGTTIIGGGVFAFFDATFAEIDVGLRFGSGTDRWREDGKRETDDKSTFTTSLSFAVLGKFPIDLGGFAVFPLLGVDFSFPLSSSYDGNSTEYPVKIGDDEYGRFSFGQFGIRVGGGADINLSRELYIRPSLLYGIWLNNKFTRDGLKDDKDTSIFNHGIDLRVAVGYRF